MIFGHHGYDANGNYYEPTEFGGYSLGFAPYPSYWAVDGTIKIYTTSIAPYTKTRSVIDLLHSVFMIGCDPAGGGAPAPGLTDSSLHNSITTRESIYEAVLDADLATRINVYVVYFTSPMTFYYDLINHNSAYTAAFVGDKNTGGRGC